MSQKYKQTIYYTDTGCKKAKSEGYEGPCLECPFVKCFEDEDFDWKYYNHQKKLASIRDMWNRGISVKKIMKYFHISDKTIYRICFNG